MSDLSSPPLSLVPVEGLDTPPSSPAPGRADPFLWPTPALACYPAPTRAAQPEVCEVEGLNGKTIAGRLMHFNPVEGLAKLRVVATRTTLSLRFEQFRRLRLLQPLNPLPPTPDLPDADALAQRPALPFKVALKDREPIEGLTVGHHEAECGLFVFEPLGTSGTVQRSFFPRAVFLDATVGQRIGEALVERSLTTPEQVKAALDEQQQLRTQRLGDMLVVRQIISPEELSSAIDQQAKMPMVRIGEALTALGFITEAQLDEALHQQKADRSVALGELLVRSGAVSRPDLQTALARKMGYPLVDVPQFPVDTAALQRLPYAIAARLPALPLMLHGGRLVVALEDPSRRLSLDEIEFAAQCKVVPVLARAGVLREVIDHAYEKIGALDHTLRAQNDAAALEFEPEDAGKLLATLEQQQSGEINIAADDEPAIEQSDNSLVRLINSMILEAQAQGVSDIHVESQPGREKVKVRFRKDGQMRPYIELPHTYRNALIARLKIMCDLDISERRKPQDGKINFGRFVQGQRLELRVATIPTHSGCEDAVLRLLASAKPLPLDKLNLSPVNLERLKTAVQRPYGMFLCVGPTGSGKTTTLHSALGYINTPERKIWTAEDPIEITQAGLRQVQVNPKIDWTFAKALRAFLRADPDVVMVGEIRDKDTSQMAIEASLTGHLVLSTLHTNSAPETVTRLLDMGMDPFNFADALLAVLAQRLVRRLCPDCRTPHEAGRDEVDELLRDHRNAMGQAPDVPDDDTVLAEWTSRFGGSSGRFTLYKTVGCPKCDNTGFRGRAGIHELMTVSRDMRHLIQTGARAEELQRKALSEGMRTLRQDGLEKVLAGVTTLDEVRTVSN
jgi:type II secretory ATPase GspE/PulE/Tfp pilus assembly ATPase PilB-like protein